MFYKKEEDNWFIGSIINFPTGEILDENNKEELNGWKWFDEEPQEYLDWVEIQEQNIQYLLNDN